MIKDYYDDPHEMIIDYLDGGSIEADKNKVLRLLGYDPDSLVGRRDGLKKLINLIQVRILELEMEEMFLPDEEE